MLIEILTLGIQSLKLASFAHLCKRFSLREEVQQLCDDLHRTVIRQLRQAVRGVPLGKVREELCRKPLHTC